MTGYTVNSIRVTYGKRDTRMWFGGFDADFRHLDDDAWVNLTTVGEFLEKGDTLPPDLAQWLLLAIRAGEPKQDTSKFLQRLGLARGPGNKGQSPEFRLKWGERVCRLEDTGLDPEAAIDAALLMFAKEAGDETVSRASLQNWRDTYRKHWQEAHAK